MTNSFLIALFFIFISFSADSDDSKYLKDIPEPTLENLRWAIPADRWSMSDGYTKKGKFFRISSFLLKPGEKARSLLYVYENPDLKGSPYVVGPRSITQNNGSDLCKSSKIKKDYISMEDVAYCRSSCISPRTYVKANLSEPDPFWERRYKSLLSQNIYSSCPIPLKIFTKYYDSSKGPDLDLNDIVRDAPRSRISTNYYFEDFRVDYGKGYVETEANGKKYYVDIRFCKEHPDYCRFVKIEQSDYEKDWIRLKKHQENKDLDILNVFIAELKPCVLKKDLACIKKYFIDPVKDAYLADEYYELNYPKITLDEEFLKELEVCLDYNQLLPHLRGMRGINKVCKFNLKLDYKLGSDLTKKQEQRDGIFMMGVDYPESLRVSDTFQEIYYIKK
jgi:hypothetical protein